VGSLCKRLQVSGKGFEPPVRTERYAFKTRDLELVALSKCIDLVISEDISPDKIDHG